MGSHYRMITDRQLANFRNFVATGRGIPLQEFGPDGAFDTAIEESSTPATALKPRGDLMRLLKTLARMSPEAWADLQRDLLSGEEGEDEERFDSPVAREMEQTKNANDEPPAFPDRPRPGGAMDSARTSKSFADMYPGAMSIKTGPGYNARVGAEAEHDRLRRQSGSSKSFDAMFPDASKIKVNR